MLSKWQTTVKMSLTTTLQFHFYSESFSILSVRVSGSTRWSRPEVWLSSFFLSSFWASLPPTSSSTSGTNKTFSRTTTTTTTTTMITSSTSWTMRSARRSFLLLRQSLEEFNKSCTDLATYKLRTLQSILSVKTVSHKNCIWLESMVMPYIMSTRVHIIYIYLVAVTIKIYSGNYVWICNY